MRTLKRLLAFVLALVMVLSLASVPTFAEGETQDRYSIVINYQFTDGTTAAPSWTATIQAGTALQREVTSPTIVGYTPDKATVTINETAISQNITVIVTYGPALVNYTVKHFQQNVDNDEYTLTDTETKQGYTDNRLPTTGLAKSYNGFTALPYDDSVKIAADGSTEVEIYYDRNYYLLNLNLDGGWGSEPVYARYGSPIAVTDPTKTGYTFLRWNPQLPVTMPAENSTHTATWDPPTKATVTVVVWGENADDENYSYTGNSYTTTGTVGQPYTVTESGQMLICGKENHLHTDACMKCSKTEHTHTAVGGSCYTLTCGIENHTHGTGCYAGVGSKQTVYSNLPDNPQEGQVYDHWYYDKLIYIKGSWYKYSGSTASDSIAPTTCGKAEVSHTHTDTCYTFTCPLEAHQHSDACMSCSKEVHTHTSECYKTLSTDMPSNLWKLNTDKTQSVTVLPDGTTVVNVYYDRTTFKLSFYNKSGNTLHGTIEDKWGAQIGDRYLAINAKAGGNLWMTVKDGNSGPYTAFLEVMPSKNTSYYLKSTSASEQKAYYYVEKLDTTGYDTKYTIIAYSSNSLYPTEEDFIDIKGFTFEKATFYNENDNTTVTEPGKYNSWKYNNAKFYYTRNTYYLHFMDNGVEVGEPAGVKYEAALSTSNKKSFIPDCPSYLEPNAYNFEGWYQDPGFTEKVDWDSKMPAQDVTVYAKWVPVNHTITFYLDEAALKAGTQLTGDNFAAQTVAHRAKGSDPGTPVNGSYEFVTWFYKDAAGVEHAFNFDMAVTCDMELYGKWNSKVAVDYIIHYQLDDGTTIAPDTTGKALATSTKTFEAKTGTALNEGYQSGYFPEVSSHSITMDINGKNEFTFVYVPMDKVPYTVKYLEVGTNKVLHEEKNDETSNTVITEKYEPVSGYMPDAAYKRLVLSATESENVIIFWYTKDEVNTIVNVRHWQQNIQGDGYTLVDDSLTETVKIGDSYTASANSYTGFTFALAKTEHNDVVTGSLTCSSVPKTGLVIDLYYDRNEYSYTFRFVDKFTNQEIDFGSLSYTLIEGYTGTARYGAQVTYDAPDLKAYGYRLVSTTPGAITIGTGSNEYTFYYQPFFSVVHVTHTATTTTTGAAQDVDLTETNTDLDLGGYSLTDIVTTGYLYGGAFEDANCTTVYPFEDGQSGKQFVPERGKTYYIWEPVATYLSARNFYVSRHLEGTGILTVCRYYLLTNVDRLLYLDTGFIIGDETYSSGDNGSGEFTDHTAALNGETPVYGKVDVIKGGTYTDTLCLKDDGTIIMSKIGQDYSPYTEYGYMGAYRLNPEQFATFKTEDVTFTPYWITLDGVQVTGTTTRTGGYDANNPGVPKVVKNEETGSVCTYVGGSTQEEPALMSLRYVPEYLLDDSTPDSVTITINDNGEISQLETLPGDVRGQLSCAAPEGKLFAGWYSDEACTTAAQLTDVQEDITVYAKYVSDDYLTLKYNRNGLFRVTGVSLVSAIDSDSYAETGFIINGETYVVDSYATRYRLFYTAGSLFGGDVARRAPLMTLDYALSGSGTLEVIPYWVTLDGTTVTGEARTLTYTSRTIRG